MNKQEFLKELQTRIRVLAQAEQQDILDEYAQHIDLKMGKGLSEEAAIADFGSLDALAAEILEAYHVNPSFAQAPVMFKGIKVVSVPDPRPALRRGCGAVANFFRRMGGGVVAVFRACGQGLHNAILRLRNRPRTERPQKEKKERHHMENLHPMQTAGCAVTRFFRALGHLVLAILRLAWNLALLLAAFPVAALGMLALLSTGTLVVLLVQGYPMVGLTLCCVGTVLCCGAVLVLGSGLRYRRAKKDGGAPPVVTAEVVSTTADGTDMEVYHA